MPEDFEPFRISNPDLSTIQDSLNSLPNAGNQVSQAPHQVTSRVQDSHPRGTTLTQQDYSLSNYLAPIQPNRQKANVLFPEDHKQSLYSVPTPLGNFQHRTLTQKDFVPCDPWGHTIDNCPSHLSQHLFSFTAERCRCDSASITAEEFAALPSSPPM